MIRNITKSVLLAVAFLAVPVFALSSHPALAQVRDKSRVATSTAYEMLPTVGLLRPCKCR